MIPGLFVSFSAPETGVFESQVLEYGQLLRSIGVEFRYLLFEGLRTGLRARDRINSQVTALARRFDTRIDVFYLPVPLTAAGLRLAAFSIARKAATHTNGRLLIQARGALAVCAALRARRHRDSAAIVYDARGDTVAEARLEGRLAVGSRQKSRWERRARRIEFLERRAGAEADHVLAVSTPLRDRICDLSNVLPSKVTVVPCCVDPARVVRPAGVRESMRRRLGLTDRLVFVYCGSLGTYQIPDRIAALVEAVRIRVPQAHLLVLTRDRAAASRFFGPLLACGAASIEDCAFEAVGDYLAAADVALLLRQDDPVNRVACPVKFAEYQVAGLPVIATAGIGDVSSYLRETGHGVLVDLADDPEHQASQVAAAVTEDRPRRETIRDRALKTFSRESYRETYERMIESLGFRLRRVSHAA